MDGRSRRQERTGSRPRLVSCGSPHDFVHTKEKEKSVYGGRIFGGEGRRDEWEGRLDERQQLAAVVKIRNTSKRKKRRKREKAVCPSGVHVASSDFVMEQVTFEIDSKFGNSVTWPGGRWKHTK